MQAYNLDQFGRRVDVFKHLFNRWIKQIGFSYNTYAVLYSLSTMPNGVCTQKEVADEWVIAKQTVFNICKDFHEKGWIEFSPGQSDKRERLMRLTEAGRAQAEPMMRCWDDLDRSIFQAFGDKRSAEMFAVMDEFAKVFEAEIERQFKDRTTPSQTEIS